MATEMCIDIQPQLILLCMQCFRILYHQSATKLVETLCKERTLVRTLLLFSKKNSRKSTFAGIPSPSPLINVVPLLVRVTENNTTLSGGVRGVGDVRTELEITPKRYECLNFDADCLYEKTLYKV